MGLLQNTFFDSKHKIGTQNYQQKRILWFLDNFSFACFSAILFYSRIFRWPHACVLPKGRPS